MEKEDHPHGVTEELDDVGGLDLGDSQDEALVRRTLRKLDSRYISMLNEFPW